MTTMNQKQFLLCGRELCVPKTWSVLIWRKNRLTSATMVALIFRFLNLITSLVCAENLIRVDGVNESPKLAQ